MNEREIFGLALGLKGTPWKISEVVLDLDRRRLDIHLDFPPGTRFPRPSDGKLSSVYDSTPRSWRHLNFFQFECYLHAFLPRIDGGEPDGVKTIEVPWARPGSGFTLLMEALIMMLCQSGMTVAEAARMVTETAHRLWRVLFHHVEEAHAQLDLSAVVQLTVDETSVRSGHKYVTVMCEPGAYGTAHPTRVLTVTEGKDAEAVTAARVLLEDRGLDPDRVTEVCADMSPAYAKGVAQEFPKARIVFDIFHVVSLISAAVEVVRRRESALFPELLKGTRYLWLKNEENLSAAQQDRCRELCRSKLETAKAYGHLSAFKDLLAADTVEDAVSGLKWWYNWVCHSRIPEMIRVAKSIKKHWDGILVYFETRLTNGPAEALNGIIQTAKRKARGFKSFEYFRAIIYLVGSKLKFKLPCPIPGGYPQQTS